MRVLTFDDTNIFRARLESMTDIICPLSGGSGNELKKKYSK